MIDNFFNNDNDRGCVEENLMPSIEQKETLFATLHLLLGTGNDVKKAILTLIDFKFEFLNKEHHVILQKENDAERCKWSVKETLQQIEMEMEQLSAYSQALHIAYTNISQHDSWRLRMNEL